MPDEARATIDELAVEWETVWLESLRQQVLTLHHRRQLHDEFLAMLDAQAHPDTDVFRGMFHLMYIEAQVMAIRRQADPGIRTLSLRRLIGQLDANRLSLTRGWYVARWVAGRDLNADDERERLEARFHHRAANEAFDQFTDGPADEHLSRRRLHEDLRDLSATTEALVGFANTTVAHSDRSPDAVAVTYEDFHNALEFLGEMLQRYYLLISQGALLSVTPVIQGDWKGPFRSPLA